MAFIRAVAEELLREHDAREQFHRFRPKDGVRTEADAYAVQGAYIELLLLIWRCGRVRRPLHIGAHAVHVRDRQARRRHRTRAARLGGRLHPEPQRFRQARG